MNDLVSIVSGILVLTAAYFAFKMKQLDYRIKLREIEEKECQRRLAELEQRVTEGDEDRKKLTDYLIMLKHNL